MKRCTVYCSSSDELAPVHVEAATQLGAALARRGIDLIYGGGSRGLMGAVARAVHAGGGRVTGIITERLHGPERAYDAADELVVVPTMRERKRLLIERGDGVIVLPGGIGTLEEFFEALTGRYLGEHMLPIGLLDVDGYYDPMLAMFRHMIEQRFARPAVMELVQVHTEIEALIDDMIRHEPGAIDESRIFPSGGLDAKT
ncbi:MAG: TIGR00730 family Rossman fold protein [Phycisphaerales bacterium]